MELKQALPILDRILESLTPHCDIINPAGSCRRRKPDVGDIEIVCVPKRTRRFDLITGEPVYLDRTKGFISTVESLGRRKSGSIIDGKNVKIDLKEGIMLDMWLPYPPEYYRHYATRTGSRDYSEYVLGNGWRRKGWCGLDGVLRREIDCIKIPIYNGTEWKCTNPKAELPPVWKSEEEFFDWIGVKWVEPSQRNV